MASPPPFSPPPFSLPAAALRPACPRCGAPGLFAGLVRLAPRCRSCGLDFAALDVGDGPAAFLILIIGGLLTAGAISLELAASPPWWVHLLWLPLALALTLGGLRLAKALLVAQAWRHRAGEGRLAE